MCSFIYFQCVDTSVFVTHAHIKKKYNNNYPFKKNTHITKIKKIKNDKCLIMPLMYIIFCTIHLLLNLPDSSFKKIGLKN